MFRIPQNFQEFLHSDQNSSMVQKTARFLNQNSFLKNFLMNSKEFFRILVLENSISVCKVCTACEDLSRTLQAGI